MSDTIAVNDAYPDLFEDIDPKSGRAIVNEAFRIAAGDYPTRAEVVRTICASFAPWANPLLKRAVWEDSEGGKSEETIDAVVALLKTAHTTAPELIPTKGA